MKPSLWIVVTAVLAAGQQAPAGEDLINQALGLLSSERPAERRRAEELFLRAMPLVERSDALTALASLELGILAAGRASLQEARAWMERSVDRYRGAADVPGEARALNHLGTLLLTLGQMDEARHNFEAARQIWTRVGRPAGVAQTHINEALALRQAGEPQRALDSNRAALRWALEARSEVSQAIALHNTAEVLVDIGDFDAALRAGEAALQLHRRVGPPLGEIHTRIHLAEAWFGKGETAKAVDYLEAAAVAARQLGAPLMQSYILRETARVHARMRLPTEAVKRYKEALALLPRDGFPRMEAEIRLRLGEASRSAGKLADAADEWEKAIRISRQIGNDLLEAEALAGLAGLDRLAGRRELALERSAGATALIEQQRASLTSATQRATYLAVRRELYTVQAGVLVQQGRVADALQVSERAHARALLDLLTQQQTGLAAGVPVAPDGAQAARKIFPPGTLVLEYLLGEQQSYVFVLDSASLRVVPLPGRALIEESVREVRAAMADPGIRTLARFVRASTKCYQMLIGAIGALPRHSRWVVVPDGALHALPFEALIPAPGPGFAALPYLIRAKTLSYAPSINAIAQLRAASPDSYSNELAVLARSSSPGLTPLPYVEAEARAIGTLYPADRTVVLTGDQANVAAFRRAGVHDARRIHFAAHGLLLAPPRGTGLALGSAAPGEDGFLAAAEVEQMKLTADLVVLSGCDTGLGTLLAGEGTLGLTRAFHAAGVPTVVSSLWKIADRSTAHLMTDFYRRLPSGTPEALRRAKLNLMRRQEWAHPYYWAAFVLSGR